MADALSISKQIDLEGKITAAGAEVQKYIVAAGGTFHIKIEMVVVTSPDRSADTVFNPCIVKIG